ncbi:MAG: sensor histidine kinase, partial [Polyangiales bacterium]
VLERAADALAARGYTATFLLIVPGEPFLAYGPTRLPSGKTPQSTYANVPVPRTVLEQLNPRFNEGRAVFLPSYDDSVDAAYAQSMAGQLKARRPGKHVMQAPIFVAGQPYGAFVLTSDAISPALAGAVEIFAAVVARTIENLRMQSDLMQRERLAAIGEAAAVMAHEVRNPVAALLNAVTLLRKGERDQAELLEIVTEESRSLERIVSHLLALGRPITPRVVAEDLRTPTRRAVAAVRAHHGDASIILHEDTAMHAAMDPDLVQIAVMNLLRNAIEASPSGAYVEVFVEHVRGLPAIRVDDRGPGIPPELATRVLEPFFTTRPAGTGIGLAAVRRIVEACGGNVGIAASDSGGGRVTLSFQRPLQ